MKSKRLLLTLLLALFVPWAAQAQQTHTVYENGTGTNDHIPVYGYSGDTQGCTSEFIIPATDLNDIAGGTISGLTFYVATAAEAAWTATFNVYMKEVEGTTLSSNYGPNACTVVYTGALDATGTTMTVTFDQNYTYEGGNLLIGTYIVTKGNWKNAVFSGISAEGAAYQSGGYQGEQGSQNFIPKTTFTYTPDPNYCGKPANVHIVENTLGPREVAIEWDAEDGELFQISMQGTSYFDPNDINWSDATTSHYEEWDQLTPDTDYTFCVRKKCGTDSYSQPVFLEFRTTVACPAPTLALVANSLTGFSATVSWTGFSDSYILQKGSIASTQPQTILSEGFESGSMPTGWTRTGLYWQITSGTGYGSYTGSANGSYNAGCYIGSYSGSDILVTPAMDLSTALSATLDFNFWNTSWGGDINILNVYYRVDGGDWNLLYTNDDEVSSWEAVPTITLQGLAANYQIGFECESKYSYGMGIDDVQVNAEVATYEWITFDNNATSPYPFNNLDPETTYRVRVIGVCGGEQSQPSEPLTFTTTEACPAPTDLQANNITINSAKLSWDGSSDSYDLQIRPWYAAGDDVLPTGTMQTYTFPLEGTGTGSVVIRHYDVTNMYYLNVDDIVIKNAGGTVIFSQDFESCGGAMPSEFTLIDRDGDGYNWGIRSSGTINGNYCLTSASWDNNAGALYPDNWLILSNIELGGEISFAACGQDPSFSAEKFCVFVLSENNFINVSNLTATTYVAKELVPRTPYDWQVKGHCDEYESDWVASYFETLDDVIVFATDGNWNDEDNWVDWNGDPTTIPTAESKVRIDADAVIPAGYVAYAKRIRFGADVTGSPIGSITMKDGGQLKQDGIVDLTIEKEITGVGTDNWSNEDYKGGWYFIASPLTTTLFTQQNDWAYVDITSSGTYDLYSFDPTLELEWLNYKANSSSFDRLFNGQGYLYANQADVTLHFMGSTALKSLNNTLTKTFEYDGTSTNEFNGWALVGNPFTCNAYIRYMDGENVLDADYYVMNAAGDGYTLSQSSVSLPPLTGAFINYSAAGTVQFSTEALAKSNNSGMLNMTVSNGRSSVDMARVRFGRGYNLKHMSFRNNSSKLFIPVDVNDYAVVCTKENVGEMPVSFKAETNGTYTIRFNTENVEFSYLHLIDNMTGADVDLLANSSYSFEAQTTDYASRFKLVFATGSNDDNFAFFNNGNIIVNNEGEATLQVMDVNGRIIRSESINGTASIKMNASAGVYMLRLINGNDVKVQKIVVR